MPVDDYASDVSTTGHLTLGGSMAGVFEADGDSDWFAITLVEGQTIEVTGPFWLRFIMFHDSLGRALPADFFGILNAEQTTLTAAFTAPASGIYYIDVSGMGLGSQYTLAVVEGRAADPRHFSNLPVLTDGAVAAGMLAPHESGWLAANLVAGETLVLDGVNYVDAYAATGQRLELVSATGETSREPFSYFTAGETGVFYFQIRNQEAGPFRVEAHVYRDDYSDGYSAYGPETPGRLDPAGDQVSGVIETMSDIDRFDIDLVAGQTVRIRVEFAQLHSFETTVVVTHGAGGFDHEWRYVGQLRSQEAGELVFTAPETGVYHLDIAGSRTYTGGYGVTLERVATDAGYDGQPSILPPLGARPAQVTHATTLAVTGGGIYTVGAATTIFTTNIDVPGAPPGSRYFGGGGSPALFANNTPANNTTLINDGVIWNYNDTGGNAVGARGDIVVNSGSIIAETITPYHGSSYTIYGIATALTLPQNIANSGLIQAWATVGSAFGVKTGGFNTGLTNRGTIAAGATGGPDPSRAGYAAAIYSDGSATIVNEASGRVVVEADGGAVGVHIGRGHHPASGTRSSLVNHGLIEAHSRGVHAQSIGVELMNLSGEYMRIDNYGVIRADVAIMGDEAASSADRAGQIVANHATGAIEGDIVLGLGEDAIINQGLITGRVDMGRNSDRFDNSGGRVDGLIDMGFEDDTFVGGAFADVVLGGGGDDTLSGAGGDDLLLGGFGSDTLDGGGGADGLYGEAGADRLLTLGGDAAFGGDGDDRIETGDLSFASIAGGAGFDLWAFAPGAVTLDLSLVAAANRVSGFEELELAGQQTLVVRAADIAAVTGGRSLIVSGETGDAVYLSGAWTVGGDVIFDTETYVRYTLSGADVLVQQGVGVTVGDVPPVGVGLDAIGAGLAPAPGARAGADLTPQALSTRGLTLYDMLDIQTGEIWESLRGGGVFFGNNHGIGLINAGTIRSAGSADADILGPTGTAYAVSANVIDAIDNSGLIIATAVGEGTAQTYSGSASRGITNQASGRIHAVAVDGYAIAINGADSGSLSSAAVSNAGDIYAFSQTGFAVGIAERNNVRIENRGVIEADGGAGSVAIDLGDAGGSVVNHGDILAFAPVTSAYVSVGVIIANVASVENHGRIVADVALEFRGLYGAVSTVLNTGHIFGLISKTYLPLGTRSGGIEITNSGSIYGSIVNVDALTRSTITNTGRIEGDILFGLGDDIYDGRGGVLIGIVDGGAGEDTFYGGASSEMFIGGADLDTATFASETASVFAHLGWGYAAGSAFLGVGAADIGEDKLVSIENLIGGSGNDILIASDFASRLDGGAGADWIEGGTGADTLYGGRDGDAVLGGAEADTLLGGEGGDGLIGGAGNDILHGEAGIDWIYGEDGDDTAFGGDDVDILIGGTGNDMLNGQAGNDALIGEDGNDTFNGDAGDDWIEGGDGNDRLNGGEGADNLIAQGGDDTVVGGAGNDGLSGGLGDDTLNGEAGDDYITGEEGADTLNGGAGNDALFGGEGANIYNGGDGDDGLIGGGGGESLNGDAGNDWLQGWGGGDQLTGGTGADAFVYEVNTDSLTTSMDRILDLNRAEGDVIKLDLVDADWGTAGDQAFTIVQSFSDQAGQMTAAWNAGTNITLLSFDMNGDSLADMAIEVVGNVTAADNFIL